VEKRLNGLYQTISDDTDEIMILQQHPLNADNQHHGMTDTPSSTNELREEDRKQEVEFSIEKISSEKVHLNSLSLDHEKSNMTGSPTSTMRQEPKTLVLHEHHYDYNSNTSDFIGMTSALYDIKYASLEKRKTSRTEDQKQLHDHNIKKNPSSRATVTVTIIYYMNIFLVLGNYILVMSHAVVAMIGEENICLPIAGIFASTLMFGLSQLRTMATLGRSASAISLLALAIVVIQCLVAIKTGASPCKMVEHENEEMDSNGISTLIQSIMRQLAALSSIGFAVGSQKLFLNIRHEFKVREDAPKSLAIALIAFGSVYTLVCVLSGPDPPPFLFDAISCGIGRKVAGFLLWVHVAVSFAINSQALCSSIDRLRFHRVMCFGLNHKHRQRWALLTMIVAVTSYFVANAVPFFKDLVALIGALTSVPLTLLLPAIFHRRLTSVPLLSIISRHDVPSYLLMVFAMVFLVCGIVGSLSSIEIDWSQHGRPFACH